MATLDPLDDILELSRLLQPAWDAISDSIPAWHPRCEGDPPPPPEGDPPPPPEGDPDPDAAPADDAELDEWKAYARKWEKRAKSAGGKTATELARERKAREALEAKLKERETADMTEQDRKIAEARETAAAEERSKGAEERRNDRLEVAVTRLAAKSFADTEDALLNVHKAIRDGDIDPDDIFTDEGKVQTDALTTALDELLERKPHLKASGNGRPAGDPDAGKGSPGKGLDDMSVEEHFQAVKRP